MHYIGMVQCGCRFRLLHETALALGIGNPLGSQDLYSHRSIQPCVPSFIRFTHAARTDGSNDFIIPQSVAGGERHSNTKPYLRSTVWNGYSVTCAAPSALSQAVP